MRYLPIFFDTKGKHILVAGGGPGAEAKLRSLVKSEASIRVYAEAPSAEILRWQTSGKISVTHRAVQRDDIEGAVLVYAATESAERNSIIAQWAKEQGIPVNAADQKEDCSFITPAIVDRDPLVVAIGTEGNAPGLARSLKADIEQKLPTTTGMLVSKIGELRGRLSSIMPEFSNRQHFWAKIFKGGKSLDARLRNSAAELKESFEQALDDTSENNTGTVALIGAGPGSLDLLTIGAQRRLHSADVIVYDRLVSQEVLDMGRKEAEYIYVGKKPGAHSTRQEEINRIIVAKALEGHFVVRLKGGDPLIFGRADEEIEALVAAGVSFEIVPGITSAAAAAASIGASLTARGHNKSVSLITGHDTKGFAELDWRALAKPNARAAIYMGLGASRFIQGRLLLHDASRDYPVTIVENASRSDEKIVQTTLGNLVQDIEKYEILGPAILLLGYSVKAAKLPDIIDQKAAS